MELMQIDMVSFLIGFAAPFAAAILFMTIKALVD